MAAPVTGDPRTTVAIPAAGMTLAAARRAMANVLREAGMESPDLDARLLIEHALGIDHAGLVAAGARPLSAPEAAALAGVVTRRLRREPVARIRGSKEFWGLTLRLNPATLVPRPETETVVEAALAAVDRGGSRLRPLRVADIGTGTGALALALAAELPNASVVATDRDPVALDCAHSNAQALGFGERVSFVVCDFGAALRGAFDLVVSNPPYVAAADLGALAPEVRVHDPRLALDGGVDGLAAYRALAADARRMLADTASATMVVELGAGQCAAVTALFKAAGVAPLGPPRRDLAGVARALTVGPQTALSP
jgi:release factor glutamine methyltransferase